MLTNQPIFHAAIPSDWADAFRSGEYRMSTRDQTLEEVGFIHASSRDQIEATANGFYADVDQLVLVTIDPDLVSHEVRWESPAPGVDELFPHIYGPLPITAVVRTDFWIRTIDGWDLTSLA